jgi:hypothetical protein
LETMLAVIFSTLTVAAFAGCAVAGLIEKGR